MITVPGYKVTEQIHTGLKTVTYRAIKENDNIPVVIKKLKAEYPTSRDIGRLKHEYEIAKDLALPNIVRFYALENAGHGVALILEDLGGIALRDLLKTQQLELSVFLKIAIQLSQALADLHSRNIIHKDINPGNIIVNPATWQTKIGDFGISSRLSRENQTISSPNMLEGTLAYMSPEQTGRMNRAIDYRTDFYSLGVTFYEMLTGTLPFPSKDPMELVHSHIAKQPRPPHQLNEAIPLAISSIVMKLLAKTAEERYRSGYGLKSDLEYCLNRWQTGGKIENFKPGQHDVSNKFEISQRLYGRDSQIEALLAAFKRISAPYATEDSALASPAPADAASISSPVTKGVEMVLVAGYPGIGKSVLVHEIHKPIVEQQGYFISGKFDQFKRNIPYVSLIQAFRELVQQILTESQARIEGWQDQLLAALGSNGQIIIDVIPEVELIIGPQPEVQALPPTETQNRFNLVFQNFIQVFAQKKHPLVIFLDDLQWADTASLKLLQLFMTEAETQALLILGSYRDNEVDASHPLRLTLSEIEKAGAKVTYISLDPLSLEHVTQLIADTLDLSPAEVQPLAELTFNKTHGNPFFVNEFLKLLYRQGLLAFNQDSKQWQWDLAAVRNLSGTDNVVNLMTGKLQKLASSTQQVLKLAAAIGNYFNLALLTTVYEKPITETTEHLWQALEEGLVLPLGDNYKFVAGNGLSTSTNGHSNSDSLELLPEQREGAESIQYKFLHDRVQQASYSLIEENSKAIIHLQIGRLLLQNIPPNRREEKIFDIVNHLNLGLALITEPAERLQLARLNLLAGQKAKDSTAYETAVEYLATGIQLLPPDHWQTEYELALNLYQEQAYCTYLAGNHQQAEARFDALIDQVESPLDKGKIYDLKVIFYTNTGRPDKALQDGLEALKLLGREIPLEPDTATIGAGFMEIQANMQAQNITQIRDIVNLPPLTDPHQHVAMSLLMNLGAPAFFVNPNLFTLIVINQVNLSLQYGNHISSGSSYAGYGLILGSGLGNFEAGYEFGQVAIQLNEKFHNRADLSRVNVLFGGIINHWRQPARTNIPYVRAAFHNGLEVGDLVWGGYGACHTVWAMAVIGMPLDEVAAEANRYADFFKKTKDDLGDSLIVTRQMVASLKGQTRAPGSFSDEQYDEEAHVARMREYHNKNTIHVYYLWKLRVLYLFEQYAEAVAMAEASAQIMMASLGYVFMPEQHFYHSLALTALYPEATPETQAQYLEVIAANQNQMKIWADNSPANFRHKYLLVEAELARLRDEPLAAMDLYDQAIESARESSYLQNEAIANELAANFYLSRGKPKIARAYLNEAHYDHTRWGATAKAEALRQKHPQLLSESSARPGVTETILVTSTAQTTTTTRRGSSSSLDLISVLKASQAISGEIVLEQLVEKLMRSMIENAGAQRGVLILKKGDQLVVEAEGSVNREAVTMLQSVPVRQFERLPRTVINYVARTKSKVVVNDAANEGMFTTDPYIVAHQPKSILALPVVKQAELVGILYLENSLMTNVFTPDRLEVLELLSAQSAISLENAILYDDLRRAEAEVRRSEEYFRALIENVSDIVTILDGEGMIQYESPSIKRILGYEPEELIGQNALTLVHPDDTEAIAGAIARTAQTLDPTAPPNPAEFRFRHKDGSWRDFEAIGNNQLYNSSVHGIVVNSRDVTERKQAERERSQLLAIQRELTIARNIQQNLLPATRPNWAGLDVICYNIPAREVGGDLYGYYAFTTPASPEAAGHYALMVGDVTGKGMPAALLMAVSLSSFQSVVSQGLAPGDLLTHLDQTIGSYTDETYQNCAMIYAEIELDGAGRQGVMRVANAGCITPIIRRASGRVEWIEVGGMPLGSGLGSLVGYPEVTVEVSRGDLIILTSDGLVEASGPNDEMFGFDRFEQIVAEGPDISAEAMFEHLKTQVTTFVGENEPYDDLTMVVVKI